MAAKRVDRMDRAAGVLRDYWGFTTFRQHQAEAIRAVLDGRDVLAVLPTSSGKSVLFQVPAVVLPGTAVVVSPLISLMKDQCDDARSRGLNATFINSHVDPPEQKARARGFERGEYDLIYVAPERLRTASFRDVMNRANVNLIAIDEAHCLSMVGFDFRPSYMLVADAIASMHTRPPIVAVTATATPPVVDDITERIGLGKGYKRIITDPIRPNFTYVMRTNPWRWLERYAKATDPHNGRYVVYAATRRGAEITASVVSDAVSDPGLVAYYHGGMDSDTRRAVQDRFKAGDTRFVCATNAFGMGIDIPDIRAVVHFGVPESLEAYVQETGRGGRDGGPVDAILLTDPKSVSIRRRFIAGRNPSYQVYRYLWRWMGENLEPGEATVINPARAGGDIREKWGCPASGWDVEAALSVMEAHRVIDRGYRRLGEAYKIDVELLRDTASSGGADDAMVASAIVAAADQSRVAMIDPASISRDTRVNRATVGAIVGDLIRDGTITPHHAESVKTVIADGFDRKLEGLIPESVVDAKRKRDVDRFNSMLQYTTADDRPGCIRRYFGVA